MLNTAALWEGNIWMFCTLQLLRTKDIPRGCVALWTTTPQMTSWDRMAKLMREQCSLQSHVRDDKFKLTSLCHMNNSLVLNYEVISNEACCLVEKHGSFVSPNWLPKIRNTWRKNELPFVTSRSHDIWQWNCCLPKSLRGNHCKNLWRQRVRVHCHQRMLTNDFRYSDVFVEFPAFNLPAI